jgi:Na+/melibiose symporter-like transporter
MAGQELPSGPGVLSGWRFAASSAVAFLVPLGLAITGAVLGGKDRNWQALGATVGLVAGGIFAAILLRLLRRKSPPQEETK